MVRQYRHAAGRALLEIPAGTLDQQGESAEDAVARELQEETGYRAAHLAPLVTFYTAPGFCTERISLFLATGLTRGEQTMMDDEAITIEEIALDDLPALIARGEIADAKTLTGLLLARIIAAQSAHRVTGVPGIHSGGSSQIAPPSRGTSQSPSGKSASGSAGANSSRSDSRKKSMIPARRAANPRAVGVPICWGSSASPRIDPIERIARRFEPAHQRERIPTARATPPGDHPIEQRPRDPRRPS
jgi:8-oxo-dGTP pyrophosphatase MutT (NUDIX family)